MDALPGVPPLLSNAQSKRVGPDKVRIGGLGKGLAAQPVNQPLVKLASQSEVSRMSAAERSAYFQSVGRQTTARAAAKAIDILA